MQCIISLPKVERVVHWTAFTRIKKCPQHNNHSDLGPCWSELFSPHKDIENRVTTHETYYINITRKVGQIKDTVVL